MKLKNYLSAWTAIVSIILLNPYTNQAQELPNFNRMASQGVPYDSIKVATESVIQSLPTTPMEEGGDLNKYKRWLNYWESRAYSTGNSVGSIQAYKKALYDYHNLYQCNSSTTPEWKFRGPYRINVENTSRAKSIMGRVDAVAMHPNNLDVMYLGTPSSGVWKTTNAQDAEPDWVNISDGYGFDNIGVTDIVIDPINPNKIYVSTGHVSFGYGIGILISTDAGASWEKTTLQYFSDDQTKYKSAQQLEINPVNTNTVWALFTDSVVRTTNGGTSWQDAGFSALNNNDSIDLTDIELNKSDPTIVYIGGAEIWKKNGTANWTRLDNLSSFPVQLPTGATILERKNLISADANGIYALVATLYLHNGVKTGQYDLIRYIESKNQWIYKNSQSIYCEKLIVSPLDSNILYYMDTKEYIATTENRVISKSVDEGASIVEQTKYSAETMSFGATSTHADIRDLELIVPKSGSVNDVAVAGTDGGVSYTDYSLIGGTTNVSKWKNKNGKGLGITEFYGVTSVKYRDEFVALGAQDNSRFVLRNASWNNLSAGDGYDGFITPDDSVFGEVNFPFHSVSGDYGISDYGTTLIPHSSGGNVPTVPNYKATKRVSQITQDGDIYAARYDLAKKSAGASGFTFISDFLSMGANTNNIVIDVSVYEKNDNIIFVAFPGATFDSTTTPNKKIFRTVNGGTSWTDISNSHFICNDVLKWHGVKSILVDPTDSNTVWITLAGMGPKTEGSIEGAKRVVRTQNALAPVPVWEDYSENLPIFPMEEILYDEFTKGRLYVASDVGLFYRDSDDTTSQSKWKCFNNGIPDVTISDIDINYCNRKIYAATHGRGLWSADLLPPNIDTYVNVGSPSGETWNTDRDIRQSIKIPNGHKLTINNATINVMGGLKIVVDQGGQLILNNATITNQCGAFWYGIEVWGNSPAGANNSQHCSSGPCLTGKITLFNSTLQNAENAVALWNPNDWNMRGGVIKAYSSTFKNNRRDVVFMAYENHNSMGNVAPYVSVFDRCDFLIDNNFHFDIKTLLPARVSLWQVRGIQFNGCMFKNESDDYNTAGIYSWDANYTVKETTLLNGTVEPSTFVGFKAGVDAVSSGIGYNFTVDTTHIINCSYGVVTNGVNNPVITRNWIKRDATYPNFIQGVNWGIYLNGANSFSVEENDIDQCHVGIMVRSSGGAINQIYNNGIENAFYGNMSHGLNYNHTKPTEGLLYSCNIHKNPGVYDIIVAGTHTDIGNHTFPPGIAENQGKLSNPADNTFTGLSAPSISPNQSIFNESNGALTINYFSHQNGAGYQLEPLDVSPKVSVQYVSGTFDPKDNCLSGISHFKTEGVVRGRMSGLESDAKRIEFNAAKANLAQAEYVYESTINGGNTQALLYSVQTTDPEDAWELRNELISSSPLSEEVLMNLIDEDILSNALLLDVLMVNEQAAQSEDIIEMLETKTTPMPAYMINTFLGLFGELGQETILSAEISDAGQKMYGASRILIAHWYADSTGDDLDSIPALYDEIGTPMAQLQKIAFQRGMQQWNEAAGELNNLAMNEDLTLWELSTIGGVQNVYGLYDGARIGGMEQVWSPPVATQTSLTQQSIDQDTRGGIYARSWLKFTQNELYLPEEVVLEAPSYKTQKRNIFELRETNTEMLFDIYPNPANDFVTIAVDAYEVKEALHIEIINSIGNIVLEKKNASTGVTNINTVSLPSGIYVVRISDGAYEVQKQILEIIK